MLAKTKSYALNGVEGYEVAIEVDLTLFATNCPLTSAKSTLYLLEVTKIHSVAGILDDSVGMSTSICKSILSSSGPESLDMYLCISEGVHLHC